MRFRQTHIPTLKEAPADAQVASHALLIRGGFMRRLAAGIYSFLPLGWRVVSKIADIVRQEMDRAGALEVHMPLAIPSELWMESKRWNAYGDELLRFEDRKGAKFCIGPTHEEVIVDLVRRDVRSYRQLPLNLYQVQTKFRDELRPRAGLMRGREFIMKDAYSFDVSEEKAMASYKAMYAAYERIFERCGLDFRAVEADTGAIGGSMSHEFQVLAESGEDAIVACDKCNYAANVEQAERRPDQAAAASTEELKPVEEVHTPGKKTVEEVAAFLKIGTDQKAKTLVYRADGKLIAALLRGDHALHELKLRRLVKATNLVPAEEEEVRQIAGAGFGSLGPRGLKMPIYVDEAVSRLRNFTGGANRDDYHLRNLNPGRDFEVTAVADLRTAAPGDRCARCDEGHYVGYRGIEVGHVFFLGTKYSEPMKCVFLDEQGHERVMVMGCYGIGVTRIAAAAIEQHHDEQGISWPMAIAPYQVHLISDASQPACVEAAEAIYKGLLEAGIEVVYDDREDRLGAKFKDADLMGVPLRVTVGKRALAQGAVEWKARTAKEAELVPQADVLGKAKKAVADALADSAKKAKA